jgi:hypothetical protein
VHVPVSAQVLAESAGTEVQLQVPGAVPEGGAASSRGTLALAYRVALGGEGVSVAPPVAPPAQQPQPAAPAAGAPPSAVLTRRTPPWLAAPVGELALTLPAAAGAGAGSASASASGSALGVRLVQPRTWRPWGALPAGLLLDHGPLLAAVARLPYHPLLVAEALQRLPRVVVAPEAAGAAAVVPVAPGADPAHAAPTADEFGLVPRPSVPYTRVEGGADGGGAGGGGGGGGASSGPLTLGMCVQLVLLRRRLWALHDRQLAWKRADAAAKAAARKREWLAQHHGRNGGGGAGAGAGGGDRLRRGSLGGQARAALAGALGSGPDRRRATAALTGGRAGAGGTGQPAWVSEQERREEERRERAVAAAARAVEMQRRQGLQVRRRGHARWCRCVSASPLPLPFPPSSAPLYTMSWL